MNAAVSCWFCGADNTPNYSTCGFCNHRAEDAPDPKRSADRLRQL